MVMFLTCRHKVCFASVGPYSHLVSEMKEVSEDIDSFYSGTAAHLPCICAQISCYLCSVRGMNNLNANCERYRTKKREVPYFKLSCVKNVRRIAKDWHVKCSDILCIFHFKYSASIVQQIIRNIL
jgi:hypothetical protein